jgi:hypothetical protein
VEFITCSAKASVPFLQKKEIVTMLVVITYNEYVCAVCPQIEN